MKVAFVGKGGSGKTTLSSLFIRHLARTGAPVLAVDADINQHLGPALGLDEPEAAALPAMGERLPLIKDFLRGSNPRIASAEAMIKTTPPGEGSRLLRVREDNALYDACARPVELEGGAVRRTPSRGAMSAPGPTWRRRSTPPSSSARVSRRPSDGYRCLAAGAPGTPFGAGAGWPDRKDAQLCFGASPTVRERSF
jgi:hypothetical protein